jgi:RNA polymerase sigma-70 factor (ECF subfamily)
LRHAEDFRSWLFQIAHNTACSEMRRLRGRQFDQALDVVDETSGGRAIPSSLPGHRAGWEPSELKLLVEKALTALPVEQREAVILKVYQDFKFTEIAEIQNCPLSTVKTRVYAGFEQLRKLLES